MAGPTINPIPLIQEQQKSNPFYNPLGPGMDAVSGIRAIIDEQRDLKDKEWAKGLKEQEMALEEEKVKAKAVHDRAMAKYYDAQAGKPSEKKVIDYRMELANRMLRQGKWTPIQADHYAIDGEWPEEEYEVPENVAPLLCMLTGLDMTQWKDLQPDQQKHLFETTFSNQIDMNMRLQEFIEKHGLTKMWEKESPFSPEQISQTVNMIDRQTTSDLEELGPNILTLDGRSNEQFAMSHGYDALLGHDYAVLMQMAHQNPMLLSPKQADDLTSALYTVDMFREYRKKHQDETWEQFITHKDDNGVLYVKSLDKEGYDTKLLERYFRAYIGMVPGEPVKQTQVSKLVKFIDEKKQGLLEGIAGTALGVILGKEK